MPFEVAASGRPINPIVLVVRDLARGDKVFLYDRKSEFTWGRGPVALLVGA